MSIAIPFPRPALLAIAALFLLAPPSRAQEEEPPRIGPPPGIGPPGMEDTQREFVELFRAIEQKLREIDILLSDAGAGEIPVSVPEDSGLDDLLRFSQEQSQQVVDDIDRLLEVAAEMQRQQQGQGSQGQGQQSPQDGESPLDQERDSSPGNRESTPEMGEEQMPEGQQPPPGQAEQPEDPSSSNDEGRNEGTQELPGTQPGDPANPGGDDAWGDLPLRAREVFRVKSGDDMPAEYRDWIDSYYRRLNRTRG